MAIMGVLKGSMGGVETVYKTVEINTTTSGGTVAVTGLSKILAVVACLSNDTNSSYGGGLDNNGTWLRIGYQGRTNGVSAVADDGSSFTWVDGTSRAIKFIVLGTE